MNTRTIAIAAGTAVLAVGAGIGVAAQGDSTASSDRSAPGMMRGPGGPRGDLSELASALGVSETRLREAMESARPTAGGAPDDMAATLAAELGISEDKVRDALESAIPQGGGPPPAGDQAPPATANRS